MTSTFPSSSPTGARSSAVQRHFNAKYICPFAAQSMRNNAMTICELDYDLDLATMRGLWPYLRHFLTSYGTQPASSLVMVFPTDALTEAIFAKKVQRLFMLLHYMLAVTATPRIPSERAAADARKATNQTFDPAVPLRAFLVFGMHPLASIGLGSLYPIGHTRFCPHDCFVLTWFAELSSTPVAARDKIRATMTAQMGWLYDADEPIVPIHALRTKAD